MTTTLISPLAKCTSLTPYESDRLFFPGTGGKVNKARQFCDNCPIRRECLIESIEYGLAGFISGTTEKERRVMAKEFHVKFASKDLVINVPPKVEILEIVNEVEDDFIPDPPKPKTLFKSRKRRRRIIAVAF